MTQNTETDEAVENAATTTETNTATAPAATILQGPPAAGTEIDTLIGSLERQRRTFIWKCGGLDAAGLTASVGSSTITLGGLLKHMAHVEADMFAWRLFSRDPQAPWNAVNWNAEPDWAWRTAADDTPEQLYALYDVSVSRSRVLIAEAVAEGGASQPARTAWSNGVAPSLRRLMVDMIEEYARHVGHADLIRESVDGLVGEDPPQ
jgi:hypothetical protein